MMLSLDTAYRSFGGEVEASSTPTICRLPDSRRHQLSAIALDRRPLGTIEPALDSDAAADPVTVENARDVTLGLEGVAAAGEAGEIRGEEPPNSVALGGRATIA